MNGPFIFQFRQMFFNGLFQRVLISGAFSTSKYEKSNDDSDDDRDTDSNANPEPDFLSSIGMGGRD